MGEEQFLIVLPSNNSMHYFLENTITSFTIWDILRRNRSDELSRIRVEISNQTGRRSFRNTIPATPRLHKSNGGTLRNFNRKCPPDVRKRLTNNSQGLC